MTNFVFEAAVPKYVTLTMQFPGGAIGARLMVSDVSFLHNMFQKGGQPLTSLALSLSIYISPAGSLEAGKTIQQLQYIHVYTI